MCPQPWRLPFALPRLSDVSGRRQYRDPHAVLGLPRSATPSQVKAAYYRLATRHHPDRPDGDKDRMAEVVNAYEELRGAVRGSTSAQDIMADLRRFREEMMRHGPSASPPASAKSHTAHYHRQYDKWSDPEYQAEDLLRAHFRGSTHARRPTPLTGRTERYRPAAEKAATQRAAGVGGSAPPKAFTRHTAKYADRYREAVAARARGAPPDPTGRPKHPTTAPPP